MNPIEYLDSLIAGMDVSEIPVQKSELELLRRFILAAAPELEAK
jgi:hypothetical protein